MNRKLRVGVLLGGESAEHEVSLQSARNVLQAMDPERYEAVLIGIDRLGSWYLVDGSHFLDHARDPERVCLSGATSPLALRPGRGSEKLVPVDGPDRPADPAIGPLDVVFPVLHGPLGEDGSVQGFLRLAHLPWVGSGVLGSAIGMDKDVSKRLLRDAGIPVVRFLTLRRGETPPDFEEVRARLGAPVFVKPANMGSSVGVHKVSDAGSFREALADAFAYDRKAVVEEFVEGREIECSVLGNEEPIASVPGEVIALHEFYSYEAKYLDEHGAELEIPAKLPAATAEQVRELAVRAFQALECEGMARVDFFLRPDGELLVNEVNTIPGFTQISMYPKLWEASGIGSGELIDRLIRLALERGEEEERLRTTLRPGASDVPAEAGE